MTEAFLTSTYQIVTFRSLSCLWHVMTAVWLNSRCCLCLTLQKLRLCYFTPSLEIWLAEMSEQMKDFTLLFNSHPTFIPKDTHHFRTFCIFTHALVFSRNRSMYQKRYYFVVHTWTYILLCGYLITTGKTLCVYCV